MKMERNALIRFNSISEGHKAFALPPPQHPLISLINGTTTPVNAEAMADVHVMNFYKIAYKPDIAGKLRYGQHHYDFDGGGLLFAAPNQIIGALDDSLGPAVCSQYTILLDPGYLDSYPLSRKIKEYGFFDYATNETLHLAPDEEETIISIFKMIEKELSSRIDEHSHDVVISQLELLLSFANRFHKRQFITRKSVSHDVLQRLEVLLTDYFTNEDLLSKGVPTVAYLAENLNLSPSYLSDMLRTLTGQNTQQLIHDRVIGRAKEMLSTTNLSVREVAYALGFEYSQSFNKLFKHKTNLSPLQFRQQFN